MKFGAIYKQGDDFLVRWPDIDVDDYIPELNKIEESIMRSENGLKQTVPLIHIANKDNSFFETVVYRIYEGKYLFDFSHEKVRDHNCKINCHEGVWIISYQKKNPFECIWLNSVLDYEAYFS